MRSLPYSDLEKGVASIAGIDPTNLLSHEKVLIAEYINDAVKYCWDYYPWAEFTKTEERYFREVFEPNKQYLAGDEVYFSDAYYRARVDVQASTVDLSSGKWYEVGDTSSATKWTETGCYYIGARVEYNDKYYVCISEPTDAIGSYGNQPCCFEINAIDPTDTTYFAEIENNVFDRYIAYEQAGKDVIGTTLSVTLSDPRYNDTKPLNWREDREGIYIDPEGNSFNSVYIRYRLEAPTYTFQSTTDEVPKFLAQAIKAFAYKSWLIGDGQHEKALLQDTYGLDLLLREVDRLDLQQDRAQPFTITKNPYRRVNARQGIQASETTAQIASVKKSNVVLSIELTTDAQGFNPVKKAIIDGDPIFDIIVEGYNAVQRGLPVSDLNIGLVCNGENAVKPGYANSFVKIFTGIPFRGVDIGQLQGLKLNVVRESVQPINLTLRLTTVSVNIVRSRIVSKIFQISTDVTGVNCVKSAQVDIGMSISSGATGINLVIKRNALSNASFILQGVNGKNIVKIGQSTSLSNITISAFGGNIVKKSDIEPGGFGFVVTASTEAFNAVKLGNVDSVLEISSTTQGGAIRSGSVSMSFEITVSNGVPQTVSLFSPGARQTDAFSEIIGATNDRVIEIVFYNHTPDQSGNFLTSNPYRNYGRPACIDVKDLIDPNFTYSVQTKDSFSNHDFFGKNIDFDDLYYPVYSPAQEAIRSGSNYSKPVDDIVLVSENSINVTCLFDDDYGFELAEKIVPVYVVATLFEPSQESQVWNLHGTEDYKVWNSNWRFRLIYVDAHEDRLVTNNRLDVGTFGGVYSGYTTNSSVGSPYLRTNNGQFQYKEIELGIYYRTAINADDGRVWRSGSKAREYGDSVPSGQLGNTDPLVSTNRSDLFNIDFNVGVKKFEYYAFNQQNRLVNLPYVSSGNTHKILPANNWEWDLLDNIKEIWHAGDMAWNPGTQTNDVKPDPWYNARDVTLNSSTGNPTLYGGDNSASFPLPVNILPDGYVRDFPQTFSSQNSGNSRGTPQDYLSNSVLKRNKISAGKIPASN